MRKDCTSQNLLFLNHRELSPVILGKAHGCARPRFLCLQGSDDSTKCFHLDFFWAESNIKEQESVLHPCSAGSSPAWHRHSNTCGSKVKISKHDIKVLLRNWQTKIMAKECPHNALFPVKCVCSPRMGF